MADGVCVSLNVLWEITDVDVQDWGLSWGSVNEK
jgi:hypothetical protein